MAETACKQCAARSSSSRHAAIWWTRCVQENEGGLLWWSPACEARAEGHVHLTQDAGDHGHNLGWCTAGAAGQPLGLTGACQVGITGGLGALRGTPATAT